VNPATLTVGMVLSAVGFGYFLYGRRQRRTMPFLSGLGLLATPFVLDSATAMLLCGAVLAALPFVMKF
jgi:hypothetical protein